MQGLKTAQAYENLPLHVSACDRQTDGAEKQEERDYDSAECAGE